ncbi:MAG: hypothetical protein HYY93_06335 [Planctomycetes bacterium]|nr:hypothetical protein [Planctomycetota bacterium]
MWRRASAAPLTARRRASQTEGIVSRARTFTTARSSPGRRRESWTGRATRPAFATGLRCGSDVSSPSARRVSSTGAADSTTESHTIWNSRLARAFAMVERSLASSCGACCPRTLPSCVNCGTATAPMAPSATSSTA